MTRRTRQLVAYSEMLRSLDPSSEYSIQDLLARINRDGVAIGYSTIHNLLASSIKDGKIKRVKKNHYRAILPMPVPATPMIVEPEPEMDVRGAFMALLREISLLGIKVQSLDTSVSLLRADISSASSRYAS